MRHVLYQLPTRTRFRGLTQREGILIEGPAGWGDFCPFPEYSDQESVPWLRTALEAANDGWPDPLRTTVEVNAIIPVVEPQEAYDRVLQSGCSTIKVKVADHADSLASDQERLEAVRDAVGPAGKIRLDANAAWDVAEALRWLPLLIRAADGVEYVEQPCSTLDDLAQVRRRLNVAVAADESVRRSPDPFAVDLRDRADVAIVKCSPLGGVRRSLALVEQLGVPCVVSSAIESSVGLESGLRLAACLPELSYACGLDTMNLLGQDVTSRPQSLISSSGMLRVPTERLKPDLDRLREPSDEANGGVIGEMPSVRQTWWLDRVARVTALVNDSAATSNFA